MWWWGTCSSAVVGSTLARRRWTCSSSARCRWTPGTSAQGIGTLLVSAAVDAAREVGSPAVFLEGSPDYYGTRGFERASARGFSRPSVRIPDPAFQVAVLDGHEEWMNGALVYCEAFWALDCVGLRDPLLAELEERFSRDSDSVEELGGEDAPSLR